MLYLFTATYPFGTAETFLEDEILCLAKQFARIEIIPLYGDPASRRSVPENCTVHDPVIRSKVSKYLRGAFAWSTFRYFFPEFFRRRVFADRTRFRTWLIAWLNANCLVRSHAVRQLKERLKPSDVCYFYWGKGSNVLAALWKGRAHFVCRFHGEWDLWEESSGHYAPIRGRIASALDRAVFVSRKGETYFHARYPQCRTVVSRLGAYDNGVAAKSGDGIVRVLSCSSVYPLKRVPLILASLARATGLNIEWTHIGDGAEFGQLQRLAAGAAGERFRIRLPGRLKHSEVIDYYRTNRVDAFINLSRNEGIPVSIMEAISFGVPVLATDVGGTSEIVTAESGILLSADPTPDEAARVLVSLLQGNYDPRRFWDEHYNAAKNYASFAALLRSLQKS